MISLLSVLHLYLQLLGFCCFILFFCMVGLEHEIYHVVVQIGQIVPFTF
jgi:hypothetical protein